MSTFKPSNFLGDPMGSVSQNSETETIARNIMKILKRTGDVFRELSFEEYSKERSGDGASDWDILGEKQYFFKAIPYCLSANTANDFCKGWGI